MPDNAIYYQMAYGILIVMFVGYAYSIRWRRQAIARKRAQGRGAA